MGGELGSAFVITFVRKRGQIASNHLGQHLQVGDDQVLQRLQTYARVTARAGDPSNALTRGATVLNSVVRAASTTQAIIDSFVVIAVATTVVLIIFVTRRAAPPHPAGHIPIFSRPPEATP
jgi:MFS transporter, DHA2 family, multidrug resistance protein